MAAAGLDPAAVPLAVARSSSRAEGRELTHQLLSVPVARRPTAVVALSDLLALGALDAAHDLSLRVPQAVSVTGFDGIPDTALCDPPLTTVTQDHYAKGQFAAELVTELIEGRPAREIVLPTTLVVRASTGPAPSDSEGIDSTTGAFR